MAGSGAPTGAPWTDPIVMDFLDNLEQAKSATDLEGVNGSVADGTNSLTGTLIDNEKHNSILI